MGAMDLSSLIAAIARLGATVTGGFHDHGEAANSSTQSFTPGDATHFKG